MYCCFFVISYLTLEVIVRFVDVGRIVDHHCSVGNHFLKLLVRIMHQLLSPIFHLEINFLTVFGLTSFSGEGFPFGLKLL